MARIIRTAFIAAGLLALWAGSAWAGSMSVTVKQGKVLASPQVFGKMVGKLAYGARVSTLKKQGAWFQIKSDKLAGWMHASALTTRRIVLKKGSASAGASASELALAGKGFNAKVEASYRRSGKGAYEWVDKMEKANNFDGPVLGEFVREGLLSGGAK